MMGRADEGGVEGHGVRKKGGVKGRDRQREVI
jgi:hypothetical protein